MVDKFYLDTEHSRPKFFTEAQLAPTLNRLKQLIKEADPNNPTAIVFDSVPQELRRNKKDSK